MVYSLRTQFLYYIYCTLLAHLSYTAHIQQLLNFLCYTTLCILPHLYSHYLHYHMHYCILCITLYIYEICFYTTLLYILHIIYAPYHIYYTTLYIHVYIRILQGLLCEPGPGRGRGLAAGGLRRGKGQNYDPSYVVCVCIICVYT